MDRFKLVPEAHLVLVRADRILLLRRRNTDYEDGKYSVIAGHMEDGETAREAICREAHEEAGIELAPDDLEFAHVVHRADRGQRVGFFFRALRWRGEPRNMEPHKADDFAGLRSVPCRATWCPTCAARSRAGAPASATASRAGTADRRLAAVVKISSSRPTGGRCASVERRPTGSIAVVEAPGRRLRAAQQVQLTMLRAVSDASSGRRALLSPPEGARIDLRQMGLGDLD